MKKIKINRKFREGVPGEDPLMPLKGFAAYEEIEALAKRAFNGKDVAVRAAVFGDEFDILLDGKEILSGTTQDVRERLRAALELLDKQPAFVYGCKGKGDIRPCNANDLFTVREGVQCGNCLGFYEYKGEYLKPGEKREVSK